MNCLITRWKIEPVEALARFSPLSTKQAKQRTLEAQRFALFPNTFLARAQSTKVVGRLGDDYLSWLRLCSFFIFFAFCNRRGSSYHR
jgi:hypothetical protein